MKYVIGPDKVHHILRDLVEWDAALTWCGQRVPPKIVDDVKGRDCLACGDAFVEGRKRDR